MNSCHTIKSLLGVISIMALCGAAYAYTPLEGPQSGVLELSGSPYLVTADITVEASQILEVEAGVQIDFAAETGVQVAGTLITYGTALAPVIFQSASPEPGPGDWLGLDLWNGSVVDLGGTIIQHAGGGFLEAVSTGRSQASNFSWLGGELRDCLGAALMVQAQSIELRDLRAAGNGGDALVIASDTPPVLDTLLLENNRGWALTIGLAIGDIPATITGSGNDHDGIRLVDGFLGGMMVMRAEKSVVSGQSYSWHGMEFPIVVDMVQVDFGDSLIVAPGSVIKFPSGESSLNFNGNSRLLTPGGDPVYFTSFKDDYLGGDTNNDGESSRPEPGDWSSVMFNDSSAELNDTWFSYGGSMPESANLVFNGFGGSLVWNRGGSVSSGGHGVMLMQTFVEMRGLDLDVNLGDGLYIDGTMGSPILEDLRLRKNGGNGLSLNMVFLPQFAALTIEQNGGWAIDMFGSIGDIPAAITGFGNGKNGIRIDGDLGFGSPDKDIIPIGMGGKWTWSALDFPVVVGYVQTTASDTLEIAPGSVIKFFNSESRLLMGADACLRTPGGAPVWFTSYLDDAHGGDTNGDLDLGRPAAGDWGEVQLDFAGGDLNDTWFAYGGSGGGGQLVFTNEGYQRLSWHGGGALDGFHAGLQVWDGEVELVDLLFEGNGDDGVYVNPNMHPMLCSGLIARGNGGDGLDLSPGFLEVGDLLLEDNDGWAMHVSQGVGDIPADITGSGNGYDGVLIEGMLGWGPSVDKSEDLPPGETWFWSGVDLPLVLDMVDVNSFNTLEIAPGSVVKFLEPTSYLNMSFSSTLLTPGGLPVWFTSFRDDARGGDTNGDQGLSVPEPGDWKLVMLFDANAELHDTWFAYGGYHTEGDPNPQGSLGVLGEQSALIWNGGGSLKAFENGADLSAGMIDILDVMFCRNGTYGLLIDPLGEPPEIHGCDFVDNGEGGIFNPSRADINAGECWWDDVTGPYDPIDDYPDFNPEGLGQTVGSAIHYRPWAGEVLSNHSPTSFALIGPNDHPDALDSQRPTINAMITYSWSEAGDPDEDPIRYRLEIASDREFEDTYLTVDHITETSCVIPLREIRPWQAYWRVVACDGCLGETIASPGFFVIRRGEFTGVEDEKSFAFSVSRAWPNPASTRASLAFTLPRDEMVSLTVYDLKGRLVRTLLNGVERAGRHEAVWDGRSGAGRPVSGGLYFLKLNAESGEQVRRIQMMR